MLEALIPREKVFFELFAKLAAKGVEACEAFEVMLKDMGNAESHARRIKSFEHEGDEITHRTVDTLHKTFVTPLDRDDMHKLAGRLDDIVDLVDSAANSLNLYEVKTATEESMAMARVLTQAAMHLKKSVALLATAKKRPQEVLDSCIEVNRLENEGDAILHRAIAKLFREEQDLRLVMKWKEIYESLELAIDRCEDVANIVEGIVVEMG
jgi:predicted phosphate transport protein (TIGR00153 family)